MTKQLTELPGRETIIPTGIVMSSGMGKLRKETE